METMASAPTDRAGYDALYREHHARVLRLCRLLLSDPDEAHDVTQEVFVKMFREAAVSPDIAWRPWLNRVAVNACRDRHRSAWWRSRRSEPREFDEFDFVHADPTPEQAVLGEETRRAIWSAFRALSARQREVFALRYLDGCSTEDTAEALGVSMGSVKRHLFRAVHQMRVALRGTS
jgi:RNA polymerase sigma-70 factor (ECF subfamily)